MIRSIELNALIINDAGLMECVPFREMLCHICSVVVSETWCSSYCSCRARNKNNTLGFNKVIYVIVLRRLSFEKT